MLRQLWEPQSPLQSDYVWRGLADLVEHRVIKLHLTGEYGGRYPHHVMLSGYTTHFLFSYRERHLRAAGHQLARPWRVLIYFYNLAAHACRWRHLHVSISDQADRLHITMSGC